MADLNTFNLGSILATEMTPKKGVAGRPRNERENIINMIFERLQKDRLDFPDYIVYTKGKPKRVKLKPLTYKAIAIRLSYITSLQDLYYLHSSCVASKKSYSALFFYLTKQTKSDFILDSKKKDGSILE